MKTSVIAYVVATVLMLLGTSIDRTAVVLVGGFLLLTCVIDDSGKRIAQAIRENRVQVNVTCDDEECP